MQYPRLVIAGTHSGVGKTTMTLALLAALKERGRRVQPFKVGTVTDARGYQKGQDGLMRSHVLALYTHLHFASQPYLARLLLACARGCKAGRKED